MYGKHGAGHPGAAQRKLGSCLRLHLWSRGGQSRRFNIVLRSFYPAPSMLGVLALSQGSSYEVLRSWRYIIGLGAYATTAP